MASTWTVEQVSEWLRTVDEGKEANLVPQFADEDIDGAALILLGPHRPPRGAQAASSCRRGSLREAAAALRPCEGRRGNTGDVWTVTASDSVKCRSDSLSMALWPGIVDGAFLRRV